jgi:hypothetical protein
MQAMNYCSTISKYRTYFNQKDGNKMSVAVETLCSSCKNGLHDEDRSRSEDDTCICVCHGRERIESIARSGSVQPQDYALLAQVLINRLSKSEVLALRQLLRMDVDSYLYEAVIEALQQNGVLKK